MSNNRDNKEKLEIKYSRPLLSVQDIVNYIDKGESYLMEDSVDSVENPLNYLGAIILNPTYQREYRSSIREESMIIESILLNIPIPEVFLVQVPNNTSQIRNVMDGRHRLNAIYRFVKGKYKLQGLSLIEGSDLNYNGNSFSEIPNEDKIKILTYKISILEFAPLENDNLERELFTRYNKATKPLQPQEIRYATYTSNTSQYVSSFIKKLGKDKGTSLYKAYNITDERSKTQKVHQNVFVLLYILEYGLNPQFYKSTELADEYMQIKNNDYKRECEKSEDTKKIFREFNDFISKISERCLYPFSIRLFESKSGAGNYLFRTGISMFLATVFYYFTLNIQDANFLDELWMFFDVFKNDIAIDDPFSTNSKVLGVNIAKMRNKCDKFATIQANKDKMEELENKLKKTDVK